MSISTVAAGRDTERPQGGRRRLPAIDGIRGLASVALLTVHVGMFSGLLGTKALGTPRPPSNFLGAFFVSGLPSFIGPFFVLPALFLYLPVAKAIISGKPRPAQGPNLVRRLLRLLPAYYLMYLVVLLAFNRHAIDGIWYVLRPIFLLQVYLPSPFVPKLMNGMEVTWTVPSMVQWYLFLPLIAWGVHRFAARGATPAARARRLMVPVPVLIVVGLGWLFFVKAQGWDNRIVFWWPQGFAPTIGIGMALAIMLALAQVSPNDTSRVLRAAASRPHLFWLGALAVYLVNCARPFSVIGMDAIYSTSGLLVTYLMVAAFGLLSVLPLVAPGTNSRLLTATLANRPVAYIGRISYGIYLWHFAMMHLYLQPGAVFGGAARPIRELYATAGFWELELFTLGGSILMATLSYYLFELPLAARYERYLARRRAAADAPAPPAPPAIRGGTRAAPAPVEATVAAMDTDQARAAVEAAVTDRDAIQANLVELERHLEQHRMSEAELSGETRTRWTAVSADLRSLWDVFTAYGAAVDEAALALTESGRSSPGHRARITYLLTTPTVLVARAPAPLNKRRITDNGRTLMTVADAVEEMDQIFSRIGDFVVSVTEVRDRVSRHLDELGRELERIPREGDPDALAADALDRVGAELDRLRRTLRTDPLSLLLDGGDIDRLRDDVAALRGVVRTATAPDSRANGTSPTG
ncbi:acyltransferase family protein [Micromonospora chersina]|uniref:acyltransferase family protein n=1 Tax=Micromonospora chersina TaxID=47854 RepID=UPI0033CDBD5C